MRIAVASLIVLAFAGAPAGAFDQKDLDACGSGKPEARIAACGRVVDDAQAPAAARASAAHKRGQARESAGDAPGAMEDYDKAVELDSSQAAAFASRGAL